MKTVEYSPEAKRDLLLLKDSILIRYGEQAAKRILTRITNCIRHLEIYETAGIRVSAMYDIKSDYRYFYVEKNYIFYRIEDDVVKIIRVLNEKQDFIQILFADGTGSDRQDLC